jgi:hypothetical protein
MGDPPEKRARIMRVFHACCQTLVRNLVRFFEGERDAGQPFDMRKVQLRAATALGISLRALKELVNGRDRDSASVPEVRDRGMAMEEEDAGVIRVAISNLILKKVHITIDVLFGEVLTLVPGWPWSRRTPSRRGAASPLRDGSAGTTSGSERIQPTSCAVPCISATSSSIFTRGGPSCTWMRAG